jgi:photosystem II stability/assembly factor-like uncharacterized protein
MRACFTLLLFSLFAQTLDYAFPQDYYDDFISADFDLVSGNGFALDEWGVFLRAEDFGGSWTPVAGNRFANGDNLVVSCVPGTQCQTAIVVTGNGLSRTTDFGATWSVASPLFATQFLHLSNGNILGLRKDNNSAITSTNGGQSWSDVSEDFDINSVRYVSCLPGTNCETVFMSGNFPEIMASFDGGGSWKMMAGTSRFTRVDYPLPGVIFAYSTRLGRVGKSTDGGRTLSG